MSHFTYRIPPDESKLKQGDVLVRTDELLELLREVHPHYCESEYTHYQVITQSCDLVRRRNGRCNSRYITIAAVRNLDVVIERIADNKIKENTKHDDIIYASDGYKYELKRELKKLFNNNNTNYFFLRREPTYELYEDSCTLLHLSISLRAYQHYDVCLDAKRLELTENFQSKLGWLVGNLYSRVGTIDYPEGIGITDDKFDQLVDERLRESIFWISRDIYSDFKKEITSAGDYESAIENVERNNERRYETTLNQAVSAVAKIIESDDGNEEKRRNLKNLVRQHDILNRIFK